MEHLQMIWARVLQIHNYFFSKLYAGTSLSTTTTSLYLDDSALIWRRVFSDILCEVASTVERCVEY